MVLHNFNEDELRNRLKVDTSQFNTTLTITIFDDYVKFWMDGSPFSKTVGIAVEIATLIDEA